MDRCRGFLERAATNADSRRSRHHGRGPAGSSEGSGVGEPCSRDDLAAREEDAVVEPGFQLAAPELLLVEPGIRGSAREELRVRAGLDNSPAVEHEDDVRSEDRRKAMG